MCRPDTRFRSNPQIRGFLADKSRLSFLKQGIEVSEIERVKSKTLRLLSEAWRTFSPTRDRTPEQMYRELLTQEDATKGLIDLYEDYERMSRIGQLPLDPRMSARAQTKFLESENSRLSR